ncbi:MAG: hypothetical protein QG597_3532, partial [Actinomycetota bacterium]|nr:hypothetical protein [Actinomycetota bacterium]
MTESLGLVLSGGGTRGAFEAGAVQLLAHRGTPRPKVITGASAGSICAAVLAQAGSDAEFAELTDVLRSDILAMTAMNEVFAQSDWLNELAGTAIEGAVMRAVLGQGRPTVGPDPALTDDPLADAAVTAPDRWMLVKGSVMHPMRVTRARKALAADASSLMTLAPLEDALRGRADSGIQPVDQARIGTSGITLRLAITPLHAAVPRYITESGHIVGPDALTPHPAGAAPGVIEGVLASSSVPVLFPPRPIGDDVYVDGGVLRNLPVEAAVHAGAGDIIAISANPALPPPLPDTPRRPDMTTTFERYAVLQFYDQVRRSLEWPLADGATLTSVFPTMNIVAPFEVQPGLLMIDLDYGWLRAAEATGLGSDDTARAGDVSDRLITGRQRAWYAESALA